MIKNGVISFSKPIINRTYKISKRVKEIDNKAFSSSSHLKKIEIPDSVEKIGDMAFLNCKVLESVTIPINVNEIGKRVFSLCVNLKSATIKSDKLEKLPEKTFEECTSLEQVNISPSIKEIERYSFYNCVSLKDVELPKDLTSIGGNAFMFAKSLKKIEFPEGLISIGRGAFTRCESLEQIAIPPSVDKIDSSTFSYCVSLKRVDLHRGVIFIGSNAFESCYSLEQIELPPLITSIQSGTFDYCIALKTVTIPEDAEIISIGASAFRSCESLQKLSFSDKIDKVDNMAFNNCPNLHLSIGTSLFYTNLEKFKETFNVKTLTLYNYNISITNYKVDIRKIRSKELKDKIDAYLREHNISDSKYFEYSVYKEFIEQMLTYLETIEDFDYRKEFNEYMDTFIKFIKGIRTNSVLIKNNFDNLQAMNVMFNNQNNYNDISNDLKDYAHKLGMEEELHKIKKEIDGYLTIKNITDASSFSYSTHVGFIKEVLESLCHNRNYNYIEAINNYMRYYTESLKPEILDFGEPENSSYKDMPISLYEYGKKLNLLNKIKEIKDRIDKCLKENGITDKKSFSYDTHQGFIREILECISSDSDYDYNDAVNNYVKYSILSANNNVNNQNRLEDKENEILMLRKQIEELNKRIFDLQSGVMPESLGRKK